jgi:hypothetical protein
MAHGRTQLEFSHGWLQLAGDKRHPHASQIAVSVDPPGPGLIDRSCSSKSLSQPAIDRATLQHIMGSDLCSAITGSTLTAVWMV